jgi:hypothetical protein
MGAAARETAIRLPWTAFQHDVGDIVEAALRASRG